MPRKNMGLGYTLTRYHRIGSPAAPTRVERDRPIECALCHTDKTVASLVGDLERWWGKKYDRPALLNLYGDLDARPLEATLSRGKAHEQAVAIAVLGEAGGSSTASAVTKRAAVPGIARQLVNPFPLVRHYAKRALASLRASCSVDLDRAAEQIANQARACSGGAAVATTAKAPTSGRNADEPDED